MFKLYRNFKLRDWFGIVLIIGLTVFQVWMTMQIVDSIQGIIKAITYVNYHNNPGEISEAFAKMLGDPANWEPFKSLDTLAAMGMPQEQAELVVNIANASVNDIWANGLFMLAYAFGLMCVQTLISVIASYVAADLSTEIRSKLYHKIEGYSLAELNSFSTASLVTRSTNDIQNVQMANLMTMRMIFAAPITAVWAICKIHATSTELTIATAIAIAILLVFIIGVMLVALPKFKIMQQLTDNLNGVTRENLTGIRIIRAFNSENYQEGKFTKANIEFTKAQIFAGKAMALFSPVMMVIMNGISLAIYWIGADLINKSSIDYATVTAFMTLSSQIIMSFVMLMMLFILWPRAVVSAKRINEALETKNDIVNPKSPKPMTEVGTIEFKNVSFKYPGADNYALSNVSFKVNQGETLAIIGSTGAGKTSLVNLLPRLYDVTEGEVLVNGVNVKDSMMENLRSKIGYVPQKGFLFKGTVKENVALGNPTLEMEKIVEACRVADADEFVSKKEEGYDFEISQGGKNVSGGQRQRLCIARAVAINPEIYVFDDSFSALDYKTDKLVRANLLAYTPQATKVIVAQRIGTIIDADNILVLDDGKVVGYGKHEYLLRNCDVYQEIALSQLSREELGL